MAASQTTAATSGATPASALTPAGSEVLIYDGDCGFCTSSARWFEDRVGPGVVVAPWQSLDLDDFGLTEQDTQTASYWVDADRRVLRGADGIAGAMQACSPRWLRTAGWLVAMPPLVWAARGLYPLIARYRYRLPGSTDACRIG